MDCGAVEVGWSDHINVFTVQFVYVIVLRKFLHYYYIDIKGLLTYAWKLPSLGVQTVKRNFVTFVCIAL